MQTTKYLLQGKRVFVAGHRGMVGAALVRQLRERRCELIFASRSEVDLIRQQDVEQFMFRERPDAVIVAAAKVGGILANDTYPAEFLYDNLMIATNLIHAAHRTGVDRLLFLGSSCIYPKFAPQPIEETALLTGPLEPTNEAYAIAKIAGIKLCQYYRRQHGCDFISAMPTNLYGPGDNFDLETSHVVPALIRKAHEAKLANAASFGIWGSGKPRREFMHVDDCADAVVFLMENYTGEQHVNVGSGSDITILELARQVAATVGFEGSIETDLDKPDGTPRKLMSNNFLQELGWQASIPLERGLENTYRWYLTQREQW